MKRALIIANAYLKGLVFLLRPGVFFGWLQHPFLFISNTLALTRWIASQDKKNILNDFFSAKRDYKKRYQLYQYISDQLQLKNEPLDYLEFGVCGGNSFEWWVNHCSHQNSRFYGFDTFEGLPENWGTFKKGEMAANIPAISDARAEFIKGLFQETLPGFVTSHPLHNGKRKIIHLDADLFSATLYALTSMAPFLKKGDVLIFDEFNVPNHEFFAFKIFSESFYVKTRLLGAVNNYFQTALVIE